MRRCIDLAKRATGQTYPNPLVGSVIVHQNQIIGEGYHHQAGQPHAEINAINSVRNPELIKESTIYVSLEPCAHFGATPPCASRLAELGFKKVVIGTLDSHKKVDGKGKKILETAGIEVITGILEDECRALNKRFFTFQEKKRPFIILKWAQSADGFLDKNFEPVQIGNPLTKQFVHQLRSQEHAIMIGTTTALRDNPSLTTREIIGRNPIRVLLDYDLKIPENYTIYDDQTKTIIFNGFLEKTKGTNHYLRIDKNNMIPNLIQKLHQLEIQSIIIEGGAFTLQQFIDQEMWDEAIIIKNDHLIFEIGTLTPTLNKIPERKIELGDNDVEFYKNY